MRSRFIFVASIVFILSGCQSGEEKISLPESNYFEILEADFAAYWYAGVAEITSYDLMQYRYGEERMGEAVLIFVTEPFSESKQVKLDQSGSEDEVTVMKSNFTKNFVTGIYPYSMMMSTFTPVDDYHFPASLKSTMSSQEWCGHTFSQFNLTGDRYTFKGLSYFEKEGDVSKGLEPAVLEDEVWNRIRINPNRLPTGKVKMIPSSFYTRFVHKDVSALDATASLTVGDSSLSTYQVFYPQEKRTLTIHFRNSFPFEIVGWTEKVGEDMLSQGLAKKRILSDYWKRNSSEFEYLRDSLGINRAK